MSNTTKTSSRKPRVTRKSLRRLKEGGRGKRLNLEQFLTTINPRWISDIEGKHAGDTAFLLGNGWSLQYYDPSKMKEDGYILGCNRAFERYPLDYLFFQDSNTLEKCSKFPGTKVFPASRLHRNGYLSLPEIMETSYVYKKGRRGIKRPDDSKLIGYKSTGAHALQLAIFMGFSKIIMVGCDCRAFPDPDDNDKFVANIFHKQLGSSRILDRKKKSPLMEIPGGHTTSLLNKFALHFNLIYDDYKNRTNIVMAGEWGISTYRIPNKEFPQYWSDKHPGREGKTKNEYGGS